MTVALNCKESSPKLRRRCRSDDDSVDARACDNIYYRRRNRGDEEKHRSLQSRSRKEKSRRMRASSRSAAPRNSDPSERSSCARGARVAKLLSIANPQAAMVNSTEAASSSARSRPSPTPRRTRACPVTIDWGDGSNNTGFTQPDPSNTPGLCDVLGFHAYTEEGAYPTLVGISDLADQPNTSATVQGQAVIADAALTLNSVNPVSATVAPPSPARSPPSTTPTPTACWANTPPRSTGRQHLVGRCARRRPG